MRDGEVENSKQKKDPRKENVSEYVLLCFYYFFVFVLFEQNEQDLLNYYVNIFDNDDEEILVDFYLCDLA